MVEDEEESCMLWDGFPGRGDSWDGGRSVLEYGLEKKDARGSVQGSARVSESEGEVDCEGRWMRRSVGFMLGGCDGGVSRVVRMMARRRALF